MKLFIATLLMATTVFATEVELPKSLGRTMKSMNTTLNSISFQQNDSAKNVSSATLADDFVTLTLHSKKFTPESVLELPEAEQPPAKAQFDSMIDQTAELGKKLAEAFRANDNAHAAEIMNQLKNSKKDGHSKFK